MKNLVYGLFILILFAFTSCSNDSSPTGTGGGLGGNGGNGGLGGGGNNTVTFTTSIVQDQQGQNYFQFKPSAGVIVTSITAVCTAIQVNQTIPVTDPTVFTATDPIQLGPVTGLAVGQQWQFTIVGKVGSATGQAYTSTFNFTVQ